MEDVEELYKKGQRLEELTSFDLALETYHQMIEVAPKDPRAYNRVGVIKMRLGDQVEAERYFQRSIQQKNSFAPALTNLGNLAMDQGNLEDAETYYRAAIEADPDLAAPHNNLAVIAKKKGNIRAMVREIKMAQRIDRRRIALNPLRQRLPAAASPSKKPGKLGCVSVVAFGVIASSLMVWLAAHLA